MKNKRMLIVAGAVVVIAAAIGFAAWTGLYPPKDGVEGAIGAANRYQAQQIGAGDVSLEDSRIQAFLQTDTFHKIATNAQFRKLVRNQHFQELAKRPHVFEKGQKVAEVFGNPKVAEMLGRPEAIEVLKGHRAEFQQIVELEKGRRIFNNQAFEELAKKKSFIELLKDKHFAELLQEAEALEAAKGSKPHQLSNSEIAAEESKRDKPAAEQFGRDKPTAEQYGHDKATAEQFGRDKPAAEQFGRDKPAAEQFGREKVEQLNSWKELLETSAGAELAKNHKQELFEIVTSEEMQEIGDAGALADLAGLIDATRIEELADDAGFVELLNRPEFLETVTNEDVAESIGEVAELMNEGLSAELFEVLGNEDVAEAFTNTEMQEIAQADLLDRVIEMEKRK